jgi:hypothetical protein
LSSFTADGQAKKNIIILKNTVTVGSGWTDFINVLAPDRLIERIIIMLGNNRLKKAPKTITAVAGSGNPADNLNLAFTYTEDINVITIRKPDVTAVTSWEIFIYY